MAEMYAKSGGQGNRTSLIAISTDGTPTATVNHLINGGYASNSTDGWAWTSGQSGKSIVFDFGSFPKKITEALWINGGNENNGSLQLQASNDNSTWVDISPAVVTSGKQFYRFTSDGTNDGYYRYYRITQVSGTVGGSYYKIEVLFKLSGQNGEDSGVLAPSYSNFCGTGYRTKGIIVGGGTVTFNSGTANNYFDGNFGNVFWFSAASGRYIEIEFPDKCLITELTWYQSAATNQGTWQWQGYDEDTASWVNLGSTFTYTQATEVVTAMSGVTDYYKKYRLQQVSGSTSTGPYQRELEFKIGYDFTEAVVDVSTDLEIDWKIVSDVSADLEIEWSIDGLVISDLSIAWQIIENIAAQELNIPWKIELVTDLSLRWGISSEIASFTGWDWILPSNLGNAVKNKYDSSGTPIDFEVIGEFPVVPPDHTVLDPIEGTLLLNFFGDYYYRIWMDPIIVRLNNPRIETEYLFSIWSAFPDPNTLTSITPVSGGDQGVEFTFDLPAEFTDYEYKTLGFKLTENSPPEVNVSFDLGFDYGEAILTINAIVVELLRLEPNEPIQEYWVYRTIINTAQAGNEYRAAVRSQPRLQMGFDVQLPEETHRKLLFLQLYNHIGRTIQIPLYQYRTNLTQFGQIGDTRIYFDPDATDIRVGEYLALYNSFTGVLELVKIATVETDGVTTESAIPIATDALWMVIPCVEMRLSDGSGIKMNAVEGTASIDAMGVRRRSLSRVGSSTTFTEFDDYIVLDREQIAQQSVDESFTQGVDLIEGVSSDTEVVTFWTNPFVSGNRVFLIDDLPSEIDFWRDFITEIRGSQKPFLLPTWRVDTIAELVPGVSTFITEDEILINAFTADAYARLQFDTGAGIDYRGITNVDNNGNGTYTVTLDSALPSDPDVSTVYAISLLEKCRMSNDTVKLTHYGNYSLIEFPIRTVNE